MKAEGKTVIPGEDAAFLYQSGGFPVDLTRIMAEDAGMTVDEAGKYKSEWSEHREWKKQTVNSIVVIVILNFTCSFLF